MGWKQFCARYDLVHVVKLSENQCGMETKDGYVAIYLCCQLSENQCGMETSLQEIRGGTSPVEREPMWDGNIKSICRQDVMPAVEREPMWDGNSPRTRPCPVFVVS